MLNDNRKSVKGRDWGIIPVRKRNGALSNAGHHFENYIFDIAEGPSIEG
jgi:hypothetical protein